MQDLVPPPSAIRRPRTAGLIASTSSIGRHVILRLSDGRPIARTVFDRRLAANTILRVGAGRGLLAFGIADNHAHLALASDRVEPAELCRRIEIGLSRTLEHPVSFAPARIRPVEDAWHLYRTVLYVLEQAERHARGLDPHRDGTALPELLGLRIVDRGRLAQDVAELLPRLDRAELHARLGVALDAHHAVDPAHLRDAASAAFGLLRLNDRTRAAHLARDAAVHACATLSTGELADVLEVPVRTVQRHRRTTPHAAHVDAVLAQLRFRTALAGPGLDLPPATSEPPHRA